MKDYKKLILIIFILVAVMFPTFSFAQTTNTVCNINITNIGDALCKIGSLLKSIVPVLITLGVIYFIWGVVTLVIADGEEAKTKGRDRVIYGLIGLVVIVGMWGLVNIVINTFGINQSSQIVTNFLQNNNPGNVGLFNGVCTLGPSPKLGNLLNYATCFIYSSAIPLIIALAVAMFIWGVVQYVINSDEEAKKEKGKQFMIWGIIGLTVMFGVWGLVKILGNTFGITNAIPQLP